jgi:murein endopeptidase
MEGGDSESVGPPNKGKLKGARRQPDKGRGFVRKNDHGPFGTDETVALLTWACARMDEMYPGTAPAVMGDISNEGGGRMRPHKSHQSGRDADVGYYFLGNVTLTHFKDASPDTLDAEKTWSLIELFLSTQQVEYFFIDRRLQPLLYKEALARGWKEEELKKLFEAPVGAQAGSGTIRHQKGHLHHLHVRFKCPENDSRCK